jgi:hypothetical protein
MHYIKPNKKFHLILFGAITALLLLVVKRR